MKPTAMSTEKLGLSSVEVCSILQSCAQHKVMELKFQDLQVSFSKPTETLPGEASVGATSRPPVKAMTDQQHSNNARAALEQDELLLREQQLEELKITDPAEYERQIRDGELEDDDTADSDDEQSLESE